VVSNTYWYVILFCFSTSCFQFLWIVHFWMRLRYYLMCISYIVPLSWTREGNCSILLKLPACYAKLTHFKNFCRFKFISREGIDITPNPLVVERESSMSKKRQIYFQVVNFPSVNDRRLKISGNSHAGI
jgi:hypothetical protein